jgi:hypothetical protein
MNATRSFCEKVDAEKKASEINAKITLYTAAHTLQQGFGSVLL